MENDLQDLIEFDARFASEEYCHDYLLRLRWPIGFRCPRCEGAKAWPQRSTWLHCAFCGRQSSVAAGTIFQDTHLPLTLWFRALWYVSSQRTEATAMGLKRALGLSSYHIAWAWFRKLRLVMLHFPQLKGLVEVDDIYLGRAADEGRGAGREILVAVAAEADDEDAGRIRLRQIPDRAKASLHGFVVDCIKPGGTLHTDGALGYHGIDAKGYAWQTGIIEPRTGRESLHRIDLVMSQLRPWIARTDQGVRRLDRLPYFLDAFTFSFNWRKSRATAELFHDLLGQAVATSPLTYRTMIEAVGPETHLA
jgi:hypothetical protein